MTTFEPLELLLTATPAEADVAAIVAGLDEALPGTLPAFRREPLAVLLRDRRGRLRGGLNGHTLWGWFAIKHLWIETDWRAQGHGRRLMARAEEEARRRGCRGAYVTTFSFQAPDFYQRCGYRLAATTEDFPAGHRHLTLRKLL